MTTPLTRRQLLQRAALLIAAPLLPRLAAAKRPWRDWNDGPPPADRPDLQPRVYRVKGIGVKVPANRHPYWVTLVNGKSRRGVLDHHVYDGDWDGVSFKEEVGCTNPAYVHAHLVMQGANAYGITRDDSDPQGNLSWPALYDYGVWCDQLVGWTGSNVFRPRSTVTLPLDNPYLKDDLRMRFLSWKASDPRYRTSWPGDRYTLDEQGRIVTIRSGHES